MTVQNRKDTISANEVNKFTYCPHQWYYERLHGAKALRARYVERNERLGLVDSAGAAFRKGQSFHSGYGRRGRLARALGWLLLALVAALVVWFIVSKGGI